MDKTQSRHKKANEDLRPGAVAHACNPSILGDQGKWISWAQEFETSLGNPVSTKNTKKLAGHGGVCS